MARIRKGTVEIVYRGADVAIHYEDGGYEPEVNAHSLDWWFEDESFDEGDVTDAEEKRILEAIEDDLRD